MTGECIGRIEETLRRVQGEFREMPGLRLTPAQAGRLWGLDAASSQAVLDALVDARFLFRTPKGAFMRQADTILPPSQSGSGDAPSKRTQDSHPGQSGS